MSYNTSMTYGIIVTGESSSMIAASQLTIYSINGIAQSAGNARTAFQQLSSTGVTSFRGLSTEAELARGKIQGFNTEMSQGFRAISGLIFPMQMGLFYLSMYASDLSRSETTLNSVEAAQGRLNDAIIEYGRGSKQALDAARALESAQINYQRSITMSQIMTVSMGLQIANMAASFAYSIPNITRFTDALKQYNIVATISKALSGPSGWAMLAGGLVIGGVAAYGVSQLMNQPTTASSSSSNVTVNVQYDSSILGYALPKTQQRTADTIG